MDKCVTLRFNPFALLTSAATLRIAQGAFLLSCSLPLSAKTVQILLLNGDRITGDLIAETPTQLQVQTAYAAMLYLDKTQVSEVKDTQRTAVPAATADTTTNTSPVVIASSNSTSKPERAWQLEVDISASTRRGKEQSDNLSATSHWEWRDAAWRYSAGAEFDYEIKQNLRKTHKYTINPGVDYFYSEQIFGRTKLDYSYNYLAADYKNLDASLGPGFSFFKDRAELRLELMSLLGVKRAYFRGDEFLSALLGQRDSILFRFASLDYDYQYQPPNSDLEWYAKGSILKMLNQPIELLDFKFEWHNELGARYWLTDKIRISWSIHHDRTGLDLVLGDGSVHPLDIKDFRQKLSIGASF